MPVHAHRFLTTALIVAAAAGVGCGSAPETKPPPPPEVDVAPVVQKDVPEYLDLVGQTDGFQDVEIRARVEGFLETMNFREGSFVRKGDLLYQIDRKPLEAAVAQAIADKATAQSRLEKAARSQVEAATAAVDKAKLDLSYTRVTSPIHGLVGTTQVKPGNLVGKGEPTLLTTVSQIDPILFKIGITEAEFLRIIKRFPERVGQPSRAAGIQLTLADGTRHPYTGRVYAIDRAVNPTTGTLGIQLEFPNPQFILRPGQYGRARALIDTRKGALLVPQRAVQELQNQYSVAVVGPDQKVSFRNVKVGPRVDTLWVIEQGVKPGERVVAEGLQFIRDGMIVRPQPFDESASAVAPAN
jgi:membrane fusion protein (multidrug efflux system)